MSIITLAMILTSIPTYVQVLITKINHKNVQRCRRVELTYLSNIRTYWNLQKNDFVNYQCFDNDPNFYTYVRTILITKIDHKKCTKVRKS